MSVRLTTPTRRPDRRAPGRDEAGTAVENDWGNVLAPECVGTTRGVGW